MDAMKGSGLAADKAKRRESRQLFWGYKLKVKRVVFLKDNKKPQHQRRASIKVL